MRLPAILMTASLALSTAPAFAHEFWMTAKDCTIPPADITRFAVIQGNTTRPVTGRMGDSPALVMQGPSEGPAIVVRETTDFRLTYTDFAVFQRFVTRKDFATALADASARGLPVLVLLDGAPRVEALVELFQTAPDGTVTITRHRTDAEGKATLPMQPGSAYLADSLVLRALPNDDPTAGPVWHSDWASLTCCTPD